MTKPTSRPGSPVKVFIIQLVCKISFLEFLHLPSHPPTSPQSELNWTISENLNNSHDFKILRFPKLVPTYITSQARPEWGQFGGDLLAILTPKTTARKSCHRAIQYTLHTAHYICNYWPIHYTLHTIHLFTTHCICNYYSLHYTSGLKYLQVIGSGGWKIWNILGKIWKL